MLKQRAFTAPIVAAICFTVVCNGAALGDDSAESLNNSSSRYSDVPVAFARDIPDRPEPVLDIFNGFQEQGPFNYEYKLPTGMVLLPNLTLYGNNRLGFSAKDDGINPSSVELVDVVNVFAALAINPTERVVFGMTPLEKSGARTRYEIQPGERWHEELNDDIEMLFYEGELDGLLPFLDWEGMRPFDLGFSVGRQPVLDHDGFLLSDTIDSVMLTRSTVPFPGSSFARISALYGWDKVDRGADNKEDTAAELYALLGSADIAHSKIDLGAVYVDSVDEVNGDQLNVALSAEQGLVTFGRHLDTTFRVATSWAPDDDTARATTGTVLYSSISFPPTGTSNIAYVNAFGAIDKYAPAARSPATGGPLGRAGILFTGNGLASGPSPIDNRAQRAFGGAIGYQMLFDGFRRHWITELGGKVDRRRDVGFDTLGLATRIEQAIGRHVFVSLDVYGILQEARDDAIGMRSEINFAF